VLIVENTPVTEYPEFDEFVNEPVREAVLVVPEKEWLWSAL
jgi:hypothetical protein